MWLASILPAGLEAVPMWLASIRSVTPPLPSTMIAYGSSCIACAKNPDGEQVVSREQ